MIRRTLLAAVAAALALPSGASAAAIQVTNSGDGPSTCPSASGCTLRGAATTAKAGDTVIVPAGTYTIANPAIPVTTGISIVGPSGAGATTVLQSVHTAGLFNIAASATNVTLQGLTLTGGDTGGGGAVASAAAHLTLSGDVLTHNVIGTAGESGPGAVGVISSTPTTLTVVNTTFNSNGAGGDGTSSTSSGQGEGGAIGVISPGTVTVTNSTFNGNTAGGNGGTGTSSASGLGGAIAVLSGAGVMHATIANSSFSGGRAGGNGGDGLSSAQGDGAAIAFLPGSTPGSTMTISGSSFTNHRAGGNGGNGTSSGQGLGGAVALLGGSDATLTIVGSSIDRSVVGGSAGAGSASGEGDAGSVFADGPDTVNLTNDTVSNGSTNGGVGGNLVTSDPTTLVNDTIVGGSASSGGNIDVFTGGSATLKNTIVAGGSAAVGRNCTGAVTSAGHNIEDANTCALGGPGDHPNTNPLLGPLQSNVGPVQTLALLAGSPAIDGGDNSGCPSTDARGVLRPAGAACDIGAFEVATPAATTGAASAVSATSATLNGSAFNPDLAGGSAHYDYGATTAYGQSTTAVPVGPTVRQAPVSIAISGLKPGVVYHYRLVLTNALGTVFGADRTFPTVSLGLVRPPKQTPRGDGITFTVACGPGGPCPLDANAVTREKLRGKRVLSVAKHRKKKKIRHRTVIVAGLDVVIPAGTTETITMKLNATGRKLEAKFKKLPVTLTLDLVGAGGQKINIATVRMTLKPHKKKHKRHKRR